MSSRLCLECVHCRFDYESDWSELTPGAGATANCKKGLWRISANDFDDTCFAKDFRDNVRMAETCEHFAPEDWA